MCFWRISNFCFFALAFAAPAWAQTQPQQTQPQTAKIDAVVNACIDANSKDKICETLVEIKQIGDDAIEIVKAYINLTPRDYALLTVANVFIQGRLRIRTKSYLLPDATDVYDIRKDQFLYTIEKSF